MMRFATKITAIGAQAGHILDEATEAQGPISQTGTTSVPPPAKDEALAAAPTPTPTPTPRKRRSPVLDGKHHVATTRLDDATYRRLRLYVTTLEQRTGERPTHQDIFTRALEEFLTRNGGD